MLGLFLVGGIAYASSSQPTCSEGQHYEGEYVETQTCNRVCTFSFLGYCMRYENRCTTTGNWVGSCVADEVELEEPTEPEEPNKPESVIYSDNLWAILASYCKDDQVEYTEWSQCDERFNLQTRELKRNIWGKSIVNGCNPTTKQQVDQYKYCGAMVFGANF